MRKMWGSHVAWKFCRSGIVILFGKASQFWWPKIISCSRSDWIFINNQTEWLGKMKKFKTFQKVFSTEATHNRCPATFARIAHEFQSINPGVPVFADVGEMKRNVRMAMMKQRYNVHELWKQYPRGNFSGSLPPFPIESIDFLESGGFQRLMSAMTEAKRGRICWEVACWLWTIFQINPKNKHYITTWHELSKTTFWHFRLERFVACGCYSVCGVTVTYSNRWMIGILCARQYETMVSPNHLEFFQSKKVLTEPCWAPWQSPSMSTNYESGIHFLAFAYWHHFCKWSAGSVENGMSQRQSFLFKRYFTMELAFSTEACCPAACVAIRIKKEFCKDLRKIFRRKQWTFDFTVGRRIFFWYNQWTSSFW